MTDITLRDGRVLGYGVDRETKLQDTRSSRGVSWWKHLFEELREGVKAPFVSDWETKTGMHWKDWGKM